MLNMGRFLKYGLPVFRFLKYGLPVFAGLVLVALGAPAAWAHGGSGAPEQRCLITVGEQRIYYSGYHQQSQGFRTEFEQFCDHIPSVGETLLVFDLEDKALSDLEDEALSDLQVELRIVRGDGSATDPQTLTYLPPQVYPSGSMEVTVTFDTEGQYTGILTLNGDTETTARFPIVVEAPSGGGNWIMYGLIALGLVGGGSALLFACGRGKSKAPEA